MKQSYKAVRMERHHKRFGGSGLNLVSLMDIFTILVFSYWLIPHQSHNYQAVKQ